MSKRSLTLAVLSMTALVAGVLMSSPPAQAGAPRSTVAISGTVYGASGSPLPRARVVAYALPGLRDGCLTSPDEWREIASATSRSSGGFTISGLAPGHYRLGAFPSDPTVNSFGYRLGATYTDATSDGANVTSWVGYADDVIAPSAGNDIRLAVPTRITGTVTDESSGAGLAGVEIRAVSTAQWQRQYPAARTDASGAYAITGLPVGVPDPVPDDPNNQGSLGNQAQRFGPVLVDTTGWHGVWLWWFDSVFGGSDTTVDLTDPAADVYDKALRRGSRIVVDVVDPAGRAVPGIAVDIDSAFPYPRVQTNSKGRAILGMTGEPGQPIQLRVRATDFLGRHRTTWYPQAPVWEYGQQLTMAPEGDELQLRMTVRNDAASVVGKVEFTTGSPAPTVGVNAIVPPGGAQSWEWTAAGSNTHCDGTFELSGLWPGTSIQLQISSPWDEQIMGSTITPSSGANFVGAQRLPAWVVNGVVTDHLGTALPNIAVDLWVRDSSGTLHQVDESMTYAHGTTDESGQYRIFLPYQPWESLKVSFTDPSGAWLPEFFQNAATAEDGWDVIDDDPWNAWGYWADAELSPVP